VAAALTLAAFRVDADCIDDAARRHGVNADVLRAIGWQESRLQPRAIGRNADGSVDVGAFQINSVHLAELGRYGIARDALADGCVCAEVAAWLYRRQVDLMGDTWQAVGAYHSHTAAHAAWYANQIAAILRRWKVMPPGEPPFAIGGTLAPQRVPRAPMAPPSPGAPSAPTSPAAAPDRAPGTFAPATGLTDYGEIAFAPSAR
jgi:hypothetical protein